MKTINNKFKILEKIDEGSMGIVYRAVDLKEDSEVIIKIINLDSSETPSLKYFKQEYLLLKFLKHPYIVDVYEFNEIWSIDGRFVSPKYYLFSMEFIKGENLGGSIEKIDKESEWVKIVGQLIETLNYIHFNGVLHNDIRNHNIFITKDLNVKFLDFGISEQLNSNESISNIKKAKDWRELFQLLKRNFKNTSFQTLKSFIDRVFSKIDLKKGSNLSKIINIYNNLFEEEEISPTWLKYNTSKFLTPLNSGLRNKYEKVIDFYENYNFKEKVFFIVGDDYSEAIPIYFRIVDYFKFNNYLRLKVISNNIYDTLFNLVSNLRGYDVENKFVPSEDKIISSILNKDFSVLDGNNKFVTYNKFVSILNSFSKELNLFIDIPKYSTLSDNQIEFFIFLLSSTKLSSISWIFYDEKKGFDFSEYISKENYALRFFEYDFISKEEMKQIISKMLLVKKETIENYSDLIDVVHKKSNGKYISIFSFLDYLIKNDFVKYSKGKYVYNIDQIKECDFSFSFEAQLEKILEDLNRNEVLILSMLIFLNRAISEESLLSLMDKEKKKGIKKAISSLVKKNLLSSIQQKNVNTLKIKFLTFENFCKKNLSLEKKYKKRILCHKIKKLKETYSLGDNLFIINKLKKLEEKKFYLIIKYSALLLEKFRRDVYRQEVIKAKNYLEDAISKINKKSYYMKGKLLLGIFHYFNLDHKKAIDFFSNINLKYLSTKNILYYYIHYTKASIFGNNFSQASKLSKQGALLAKKNNLTNFRYYFFNIKGMLYGRQNKNSISESYYDIVYSYILKNGFSSELINFAHNYFLRLNRMNKTNKIRTRAENMLEKLNKENLNNKNAFIHVYDQLARINIKTGKYKQALINREKAYALAFEIQNIDEMIRMRENIIIPKYYLNYQKDEIIDDLEEVINLSIKYKREESAINSFGNIILLTLENGSPEKAVKFFKMAKNILPLKKLDTPEISSIYNRGILIFSFLGCKKKAYRLFKKYYKKILSLNERQQLIYMADYIETKGLYYIFNDNYNKCAFWTKKAIDHFNNLEDKNILTISKEHKLQLYLDYIEILNKVGKKKNSYEIFQKIKKQFPKYEKYKDINWNYYKALLEEKDAEKKKMLNKAIKYVIKNRNYLELEDILLEYFKPSKEADATMEYYNNLLLALFSLRGIYKKTPEKYKNSWIKRKKIQKLIELFKNKLKIKDLNLNKKSLTNLLEKNISKFETVYEKITEDKQKIINDEIWEANPDNYLEIISKFLKNYFTASKIKISYNNTTKEIKDNSLYKESETIDKELVENCYIDGEYQIERSYRLGDPISKLVIPIINPYNKNRYYAKEKRVKSMSYRDYYYGYIYIDTKYPISNINKYYVKKVKIYVEFLSIFINYTNVHNTLVLDDLTKLFNREHFLKKVKEKISHLKEKNKKAVFMIIDIDFFKDVNDTYGHQKGDAVLKEIANILKKNIRNQDLIGRYGGEEFILFLSNIDKKESLKKAEEIRKAVESKNILPNRKITVSIGCSMFPDNSQWINILINLADIAMYNAKQRGRNQVVCWNKDLKIKKTKQDVLSGFITDNLHKSKDNLRKFFNFIDYKPGGIEDLIKEFISNIKEIIPNKYLSYNLKIFDRIYKEKDSRIKINHKKIDDSPSNKAVILENWQYMDTNESLYYDLVYKIEQENISGTIVLSSPSQNTEYKDNEKNVLQKYVTLFMNKMMQFINTSDRDQHQ
ncbi:MAG TPA: diguanylate cyclase [Candidatus Mcinerneyibacterium sp.]|nr:diguanylate cyclase [Candidatus Mcinerneyibacterium sp.]